MTHDNAVNRFSKENSQNWRSRANVHEKNVADLLIERAEQGMCVQGAFMYEHPELYGRSPRSRVSDLIHKKNWDIGSKPGEHGCACYWVRRGGDGRTFPTQRFEAGQNSSPRPQLVKQPDTSWDERQRVTGLPLFDLAPRP